jgi:ABC-2 type transport system permease protein
MDGSAVRDYKTEAQQVLSKRRLPLFSLLRFRWAALRNQFLNLKNESRLKIIVVSILAAVFWIGLFLLFMSAFKFLNENVWERVRMPLIQRIMSLFFLALTFMLVFSNAVISFSSLFKAPETAFLFSMPVGHDTIFLYKLLESLLFSSWAIFAIGLPLMLAYGIQSGAEWYFYPLVFIFMCPFVLLPAALGSLLGLVLTALVPRKRGTVLAMLALVLLVLASYVAMAILNVQRQRQVEMEASVQAVLDHLRFTQQPLTPNYWMTHGILAVGNGLQTISGGKPNWLHAGTFFGALASSAAFFLALGWFVSGVIYEHTYSLASAGDYIKRVVGRTRVEKLLAPLTDRHPEVMILLIKDIKTFMRDPAQWSQVLIFFGILTLYIGNLRNFSYPLDQPFYQNLISFLNLGATSMTLATMTSRFVYPLISLEGHRFWVLGLVPIRRRDIMMSKFYFSFSGAVVLTTSLVWLSNYILRSQTFVMEVQLATAVLIALGLSGLSVGMGAIFPAFNERNPSKIVSGFGGTLTLILAICLVVFTIMGEALVCHRYLVLQASNEPLDVERQQQIVFAVIMAGVTILNVLAAYIPMRLGIKALEKVEF